MRTTRSFPLLAAAALALTACGGDDDTAGADPAAEADASDDASTSEETDADEAAADDEASGGDTVATAETDLGEVLVDGDGMTLYLFDPDEQGPSTCYDDCAAAWPPLTGTEPPAADDGVDADLLGTVERDDGALQVTYDGWPLYHWASDAEPGDTTGQGVQDVWWVVAPDGSPVRDAPAEEETGSDTDTGY